MSALLELAARCESATGPDRRLDAKIALACNPEFSGWIEHPANNDNQYGELAPSIEAFDDWLIRDGEPCLFAVADYTASIDAAMLLVPEGFDWIIGRTNDGLTIHACCGDRDMRFGNTPALALTAAALRARATGEQP